MSTALENLRRDVRRRMETDYVMPIWFPYLPYILILIGAIGWALTLLIAPAAAAGGIIWFVVLMIAGVIINIFVLYRWIRRRNEHFNRRILLHESLRDFVSELGKKRGKDIEGVISQIDRDIRESRFEDTEKNAVLWALLPIIPWVGFILLLYVYHFLNRDFVKHFRREVDIIDGFRRALKDLNVEGEVSFFRRSYEFPDRSTALYVVLYIVTIGFFGLYWIYTLTKDPNEHFKEHAMMEEEMLTLLEGLE